MRYLFIPLLVISLLASPAVADEKNEVAELVRTNVDAIVALLKDDSIVKTERNARIIAIVNPLFDYGTMAKLSLGKKHWPTLNEKQQAEFSELFTRRLQESYLEKLDIYTDETVRYGEPQTVGKQVHAPTTLVAKDSEIEILYKLYQADGKWKIYDVEIGGVSVIQTYRSQFDGVLAKGTVDELLSKLRNGGEFSIPGPKES